MNGDVGFTQPIVTPVRPAEEGADVRRKGDSEVCFQLRDVDIRQSWAAVPAQLLEQFDYRIFVHGRIVPRRTARSIWALEPSAEPPATVTP